MTRFRDAKVCNNMATDEIDDHRTQSGEQFRKSTAKSRKKIPRLVLRLRHKTEHETNDDVTKVLRRRVEKKQKTNDNVTTKTQSTFHTAHMDINT